MTSQTPRGDCEKPPQQMTRHQVARRLGTHITTVRRLERSGKLNPTRNDHGVWLFDPREVEQIASARTLAATSGAVAAKVFQALRDGFSLRDIVIAFELPPHVVRGLYADWQAMEPPRRGVPSGLAPPSGHGAPTSLVLLADREREPK
ncbi:MAG: MerR family transcriptional regulator [Polyangiaceae bacterium]